MSIVIGRRHVLCRGQKKSWRMSSIISFEKPAVSASSAEDLKQSILDKIERKTKQIHEKEAQKIADATAALENKPEKTSRRKPKRSIKDAPERLNRTIFIGNVPSKCCTDKQMQRELKNIFSAHGPVESLRFRSLVLSEAMPRKHAFISGQLSDKADSNNAYIVMKNADDAQKCLTENARPFHGHHLRVDIAGTQSKVPSHKKSVFVGNIPLDVSEETLWKAFADCGEVSSVRVIRDKKTGQGKGFAYVAFKDRATVKMGLLMDGTDIGGRKIRVQKCAKPGEQPKSKHESSQGKPPKKAYNPKKSSSFQKAKPPTGKPYRKEKRQ